MAELSRRRHVDHVTINDNDAAAVTVDDVTEAEGTGLLFTVSLDNAVAGRLRRGCDTRRCDRDRRCGAAGESPEDYDNVVATLNFCRYSPEKSSSSRWPHSTMRSWRATETFTTSLNASDPLVTDSDTGTGTLTDGDSAALTVDDVTVAEGGGLLFTVTLDNAVAAPFTVDATFADVTATGGAAPLATPEDYDNALRDTQLSPARRERPRPSPSPRSTMPSSRLTETFTVTLSASDPLVTDSDTGTGTLTDGDLRGRDRRRRDRCRRRRPALHGDPGQRGGRAVHGRCDLRRPDRDGWRDTAGHSRGLRQRARDPQLRRLSGRDPDLHRHLARRRRPRGWPRPSRSILNASDPLVTDSDTGTGTLTDGDSAAVTVDDVTAAEGGGLLFTVTLDNAVAAPFTVDATFADVTATGGATPLVTPEDYDNALVTLNFAGSAGETQTFTVASLDDAVARGWPRLSRSTWTPPIHWSPTATPVPARSPTGTAQPWRSTTWR